MNEIVKLDGRWDLEEAASVPGITKREMARLRLPPKRVFTAEDVRRIRAATRLSQPVFAAVLNVGKSTVAQWEQGVKKPSASAVRLLDIIDRKGVDTILG